MIQKEEVICLIALGVYESLILYLMLFTVLLVMAYISKQMHVFNYQLIGCETTNQDARFTLNRIIKSILFFSIILIISIIFMHRVNTGTDYDIYKSFYDRTYNSSFSFISIYGGYNTELIPYLLVKLSKITFNSYAGFLFYCAFITFFFLIVSLKYYDFADNFPVALLVILAIYFAPSMNIVRQMMAVSIIFWGVRFCINRKYLRYIIIVLIATLVHTASLFCLSFILFTLPKKINKFWISFIILCLILLPFGFSYLFTLMSNFDIFSKYTFDYTEKLQSFSFNYKFFIIRFPSLLIVLYYFKSLVKYNKNNLFFILLFLTEFSAIIMSSFMLWAFRIMYFGMISEIVLMPQIVKITDSKYKIFVKLYVYLYYFAYFVLVHMYLAYDGIFPYIYS